MNRALVLLVVLEAAVIVLLAYLYLSREPTAHEDRDPVTLQEQAERRPTPVPAADPAEPEPTTADRLSRPAAPPPDYAVVHGCVSDSSGKPVTAAWVTFRDEGGRSTSVQTQQDGHYAIAGLEPGHWVIHVLAYEQGSEKDVPVTLEAGATRRDIVIPETLAIQVRFVTPEGEDLAAAMRKEGRVLPMMAAVIAVATKRPPGDHLPMTELGGHSVYGAGRFRGRFDQRKKPLPEGVAGVLIVKEPLPVHVSAVFMHLVLETRKITEPVEELRFVIAPERVSACLATVKLRVLDASTNEPLPARVTIHSRQSRTFGPPLARDEEGWLNYTNVPPGLKVLEIEAPDYESVLTYVRVPRGGSQELGTFRLHKAVTIRGRVLDPAGQPVGCRLVVRHLDRMAFPQPLTLGRTWQSDAEGRFEVPSVGRGRHLLLAEPQKWARAAVVADTSGGAVDNVEIRLREGTAVTLDTRSDGARHYLVTVRDARALPCYACTVRSSWPRRVSLAPGTYTIEISDDQSVRRTESLRVGTEPLTLPLKP